jgi:uncharacterized protein (TIGR00369 family)
MAIADELRTLSGLDALRAMIDRKQLGPAMARTLNFVLVEVAEGFAAFEGEPGPALLNPQGTVHGGWALALIDSCTGCAAHTLLPAGVGYTTVETKGNFVRPITPATGKVRAEGRVVAAGKTIITAEGRVLDGAGRILAHGTSTLIILRP